MVRYFGSRFEKNVVFFYACKLYTMVYSVHLFCSV